MQFWNKLFRAEIVETNKKLEIKVLSQNRLLIYVVVVFLVFSIAFLFYGNAVKSYLLIVLIVAFGCSHLMYLVLSLFNSNDIMIMPKRIYVSTKNDNGGIIHLYPPFCIDLFVKSKKNSIYIKIYNNGEKIGHFILENGADLTKIIDGITKLLKVKLKENYKLSNGEVLSFRSNNKAGYSLLDFGHYRRQWTIASKVNHSNFIRFDFSKKTIRNYSRTIALSKINTIEIQQKRRRFDVFVHLKNKENVRMIKYSSMELNIIRDTRLLKTALENRKELQGIEIQLTEK